MYLGGWHFVDGCRHNDVFTCSAKQGKHKAKTLALWVPGSSPGKLTKHKYFELIYYDNEEGSNTRLWRNYRYGAK